MPPHVQELFGGRSLPLLDGDVHAASKRPCSRAFPRGARLVSARDPGHRRTLPAGLVGRGGEIRWLDEMKKLAIEVICSTVIGMPPGDEMDRLRRDYDVLTGGFAALPVNIPGTAVLEGSESARPDLRNPLGRVREKRSHPAADGLSRSCAEARRTRP